MLPPSRQRRQQTSQQSISPRFPPSPNVGDQFTTPDGRVFEWDGSAWILVAGGGGGALTDPTTTKGDLIVRPAALPTALARLPVGTNGQVLTADSTATQGVAWKAGGGTASYVHVESPAANAWVIAHNLDFKYVSVLTVSDTGDWIIGDVTWTNDNRVDIAFSRAVAGTAVIRR